MKHDGVDGGISEKVEDLEATDEVRELNRKYWSAAALLSSRDKANTNAAFD